MAAVSKTAFRKDFPVHVRNAQELYYHVRISEQLEVGLNVPTWHNLVTAPVSKIFSCKPVSERISQFKSGRRRECPTSSNPGAGVRQYWKVLLWAAAVSLRIGKRSFPRCSEMLRISKWDSILAPLNWRGGENWPWLQAKAWRRLTFQWNLELARFLYTYSTAKDYE